MGASAVSGLAAGTAPYLFAVCGWKNSGKTTLITQLIPELKRRGYEVAVIKHDGHDFESDVPGTDSWRHREAGAYGTAVFSGKRVAVMKEVTKRFPGMDERQIAELFPEADVILIEGLKDSDYPKYICRYPEEVPQVEEIAEEIVQGMVNGRQRGQNIF